MSRRNQPNLFDDVAALPPPSTALVSLAQRIPPSIRFGTSTWTYNGWAGEVYHRSYRSAQPARRLEEYARYPLFRTVGIDSAFYEPPSDEILAEYARALPSGFPCVSKVWDRITARRFTQDPRWGNLAGQRKPDFLNADLFKDAVHGAVLARHGVAHVFNSWNEMPAIGEQLELPWTFPAGFTVVRGLLRPGRAYADAVKLFEPYDRIRDPQPEVRHDLLRLIAEVMRRHMEALILVNNRLEGNAPGTIRAVVEMMGKGRVDEGAKAACEVSRLLLGYCRVNSAVPHKVHS